MKKFIYASFITLLSIGMVSCGSSSSTNTEALEINISSSDWYSSGTSGNSNYQYYASKSVSAITSDVFNNGAVLAYITNGSTNAALPYAETFSGYTRFWQFQYQVGTFILTVKDSDLLSLPGGTITIKLVIVKPKNMPMLDGVNINNYYEVSEALNLDKE